MSSVEATQSQGQSQRVDWDQLLSNYLKAGFNAERDELQEILDGKRQWNKDHVRVLINSLNDWLYFKAKANESIPQIRLTSTRKVEVYFPYAQTEPEPELENGRFGKYGKIG